MSDSNVNKELEDALNSGNGPTIARFALACISGAVPFAGGVIGGLGSAWGEKEQSKLNSLFHTWLKLQEDEIKEIGLTLAEVMIRLDKDDQKIQERLESPEYLKIVKKCFRDWSAAESEDKRILIRNLLANAASTQMCTDDVIMLFVEWIDRYSEAHFKVIKSIYNENGITRGRIWEKVYGDSVQENSGTADLFKLIIQDLSMGHVIRQHREVDYYGNFVKPGARRSSNRSKSQYYTSAFDDEKEYELTELGQWFVHYTLNEIVPKISSNTDPDE